MAADAADAAIDVYRVIEIRKIRHLVDSHPIDRVPGLPTLADGRQFGIVGLNLRVTVHARLCCGHIRVGRNLHVRVAIPAVHPELRHMYSGVR